MNNQRSTNYRTDSANQLSTWLLAVIFGGVQPRSTCFAESGSSKHSAPQPAYLLTALGERKHLQRTKGKEKLRLSQLKP